MFFTRSLSGFSTRHAKVFTCHKFAKACVKRWKGLQALQALQAVFETRPHRSPDHPAILSLDFAEARATPFCRKLHENRGTAALTNQGDPRCCCRQASTSLESCWYLESEASGWPPHMLRRGLEGTVGDCAFRYATALLGASPSSEARNACFHERFCMRRTLRASSIFDPSRAVTVRIVVVPNRYHAVQDQLASPQPNSKLAGSPGLSGLAILYLAAGSQTI